MSSKEWRKYIFSDFVTINPFVKLDPSKEYSFVEMKDLNENNKYAYPSAQRKPTGGARFQDRDTLFARITPCLENGKICQVKQLCNGVGFGSTEFLVFRGKAGISDIDFVYYLSRFNEVRRFAEQNMHGTSGRQRVTREAFDKLEIKLPPLPTQRRIADVLSALDDKIELNRQTNATLEAISQAIFKEWFVDFNFPGATGELVESELGMIPKGLRVGKLGEIVEFCYGKGLKSENREIGGFPVVGSNGILGTHSKYLVEGPGIVIGRKGTIGAVTWIQNNFFPIDTTFFIKDLLSVGKLYFHYFLLRNQDFQKIASDTAVPGLNRNQGYNNLITIPSNNIIIYFNDLAHHLFELINCNTQQIANLTKVRDFLLPKLLSGEIDLDDLQM